MTSTMTMTQPSTRLRVNQKNIDVKWGDICYVDFGENEGSEQNGIRPAIIIQNDIGNAYSPTTIVASITSQKKKHLPTHVVINPCQSGLKKISTIMFEQIRTIDKSRIVYEGDKLYSYIRGNMKIFIYFDDSPVQILIWSESLI